MSPIEIPSNQLSALLEEALVPVYPSFEVLFINSSVKPLSKLLLFELQFPSVVAFPRLHIKQLAPGFP
jgi:hypothetical protein